MNTHAPSCIENPPLDREVTPDELYANPQWRPCELINGKVVPRAYAGHWHGEIGARLLCLLHPASRSCGKLYSGGTGFISPDGRSVLAPDAMFISSARIPPRLSTRGYLPVPPDFAAEILTAAESIESISPKIDFYLTIGVELVWVVHPKAAEVHVHRLGAPVEIIRADGVLNAEPTLSGLTLPVRELFEE